MTTNTLRSTARPTSAEQIGSVYALIGNRSCVPVPEDHVIGGGQWLRRLFAAGPIRMTLFRIRFSGVGPAITELLAREALASLGPIGMLPDGSIGSLHVTQSTEAHPSDECVSAEVKERLGFILRRWDLSSGKPSLKVSVKRETTFL